MYAGPPSEGNIACIDKTIPTKGFASSRNFIPNGRCSASVRHFQCDVKHVSAIETFELSQSNCSKEVRATNAEISSGLRLANATSDIDSSLSGALSHPSQDQRYNEQNSADRDKYCRPESVLGHPLGGPVHRLCGSVHAFLGGKVRYLPLAGFFFAPLAGISGGVILDNLNRKRCRNVWYYWTLLLISLPAGAVYLLLGLR